MIQNIIPTSHLHDFCFIIKAYFIKTTEISVLGNYPKYQQKKNNKEGEMIQRREERYILLYKKLISSHIFRNLEVLKYFTHRKTVLHLEVFF